jgi:hypothetical protein
VLKDEEMQRYKDAEVKKTMEVELLVVKQERDKVRDIQTEYEKKLAEMRTLQLRLEKEMAEELERFKSNYKRQLEDKEYELHRRTLVIDEDENRVKL